MLFKTQLADTLALHTQITLEAGECGAAGALAVREAAAAGLCAEAATAGATAGTGTGVLSGHCLQAAAVQWGAVHVVVQLRLAAAAAVHATGRPVLLCQILGTCVLESHGVGMDCREQRQQHATSAPMFSVNQHLRM